MQYLIYAIFEMCNISPAIRVEVQHDSRGVPGEVSWAQNLTVTVAGAVVDLLQGGGVKVRSRSHTSTHIYAHNHAHTHIQTFSFHIVYFSKVMLYHKDKYIL